MKDEEKERKLMITYGYKGVGCPDAWVKAHGYDWIYYEETKKLYWCTNYQCAEQSFIDPKQFQLKWHNRNFFYKLLENVKKDLTSLTE